MFGVSDRKQFTLPRKQIKFPKSKKKHILRLAIKIQQDCHRV